MGFNKKALGTAAALSVMVMTTGCMSEQERKSLEDTSTKITQIEKELNTYKKSYDNDMKVSKEENAKELENLKKDYEKKIAELKETSLKDAEKMQEESQRQALIRLRDTLNEMIGEEDVEEIKQISSEVEEVKDKAKKPEAEGIIGKSKQKIEEKTEAKEGTKEESTDAVQEFYDSVNVQIEEGEKDNFKGYPYNTNSTTKLSEKEGLKIELVSAETGETKSEKDFKMNKGFLVYREEVKEEDKENTRDYRVSVVISKKANNEKHESHSTTAYYNGEKALTNITKVFEAKAGEDTYVITIVLNGEISRSMAEEFMGIVSESIKITK